MNWFKQAISLDHPMSFDSEGNFYSDRFVVPQKGKNRLLNFPKTEPQNIAPQVNEQSKENVGQEGDLSSQDVAAFFLNPSPELEQRLLAAHIDRAYIDHYKKIYGPNAAQPLRAMWIVLNTWTELLHEDEAIAEGLAKAFISALTEHGQQKLDPDRMAKLDYFMDRAPAMVQNKITELLFND